MIDGDCARRTQKHIMHSRYTSFTAIHYNAKQECVTVTRSVCVCVTPLQNDSKNTIIFKCVGLIISLALILCYYYYYTVYSSRFLFKVKKTLNTAWKSTHSKKYFVTNFHFKIVFSFSLYLFLVLSQSINSMCHFVTSK